jgi:hypothetical protein
MNGLQKKALHQALGLMALASQQVYSITYEKDAGKVQTLNESARENLTNAQSWVTAILSSEDDK